MAPKESAPAGQAELVKSLTSFVWTSPGKAHSLAIGAGQDLRADEPVVRALPHYFAPVGLSTEEYGQRRVAMAGAKGDRNARIHAAALERERDKSITERIAAKLPTRRRTFLDEPAEL